jgi:hypothetical protein
LPGYDPDRGILRATRDADLMHDDNGASLAVLGRAHPLVRRTIGRIVGDADIGRVAAAYSRMHSEPTLLLTYVVEVRNALWIVLRQPIGVWLSVNMPPVIALPGEWLSHAVATEGAPPADVWRRLFQSWAEPVLREAAAHAEAEQDRIVAAYAEHVRHECEQDGDHLRRWLRSRATAVCGESTPNIADLFGRPGTLDDWRSLADPLRRLAAFAADTAEPPAKRRAATAAIEICERRRRDRELRLALSLPALRPIGMLMLVPAPSA